MKKHEGRHTRGDSISPLLNMRKKKKIGKEKGGGKKKKMAQGLVVISANPSVTTRDDGKNVFVASLATAGDGS